MSERVNIVAHWGDDEGPGSNQSLEVVRLGSNQVAVLPFTTDTEVVRLHFCDSPELRGFVHCNGPQCVLCRAGRSADERALLGGTTPGPPQVADWLYVARNFDAITADDAHFADPFTCGRPPVAFYRLTAERYAFLRDRLRRAREAHESGLLTADRIAEAERRFGLIEDWARQHLLRADLVRAQSEELLAVPW